MFGLPFFHVSDFLFLGFDDVGDQLSHFRIFPILQLHFCHIDRALMMRNHMGNKIFVSVIRIRVAFMPFIIFFPPSLKACVDVAFTLLARRQSISDAAAALTRQFGLSRRQAFLRLFFDENAVIELLVEHVVSANPFDVTLVLLSRLNKERLLPEDTRVRVVERIRHLAELNFSDCFVDRDFVGKLVSAEENAELLARQKDVIYLNTDEILDEAEAGWSVDEDAEDAFYYIRRLVERFQEENEITFGAAEYSEAESVAATEFLAAIKSKVDLLKQRQSVAESYDELETEEAEPGALPSSRSIFDDVDE